MKGRTKEDGIRDRLIGGKREREEGWESRGD
jgi:hypothetical protein